MELIPESMDAWGEVDAAGFDEDRLRELRRVGRRVRAVVPGCLGLSVAYLLDDVIVTLVATDADTAALDAVQYLTAGPCVRAAHNRCLVAAGHDDSLLDEEQWRTFAEASAAKGVLSTLTLPIVTADQVVGSVNLYGDSPRTFEGHHDELAELLGAWAEGAVTNADLAFETQRRARQMPVLLRDRATVETAVGLLAGHQGLSVEDAEERLHDCALRSGVSPARVARILIELYA